MEKITVLLSPELVGRLTEIAIRQFKAGMNPTGTRIELSPTLRALLQFAVDHYENFESPSNENLNHLTGKVEELEDKVNSLFQLNDELLLQIKKQNSTSSRIKLNSSIIPLNTIDAALASGYREISKEEICKRFGWDISSKNLKSNFRNLRVYSPSGGKYAGFIFFLDNGTFRYFFKE